MKMRDKRKTELNKDAAENEERKEDGKEDK